MALETGLSLWGAIGEAIRRQLLPQRALAALKSFRDLIEDARAMLAGTFAEHLSETADGTERRPRPQRGGVAADRVPTVDANDSAEIRLRSTEFAISDFGSADSDEDQSMRRRRSRSPTNGQNAESDDAAFSPPRRPAHTAELLKFLIDRTGYIKQLEEEDTPEALSRIENLHELVNAAMDSHDRGETLDQFLDHAALVSDADDYDERAQITLMTLHAAKGLDFRSSFCAAWKKVCFRTRARCSSG